MIKQLTCSAARFIASSGKRRMRGSIPNKLSHSLSSAMSENMRETRASAARVVLETSGEAMIDVSNSGIVKSV